MKGKGGPRPEDRTNGAEHSQKSDDVPTIEVRTDKVGQLFSEPEKVTRSLSVAYSPEEIAEIHKEIAGLAVEYVRQQQMMSYAKERAKGLQAEQAQLVAKLNHPFKLADIICEWRIRVEENAKDLVRLDTGEIIETRPLSEEDRQSELFQALTTNIEAQAAGA